jgi:hypothetical protein
MKIKMHFIALVTVSASSLAFAIENDELRGKVMDVDPIKRELTVRVLEAGDNVDIETEAVKTFDVPHAVRIQPYSSFDVVGTMDDIEKQDEVVLELDSDDPDLLIFIHTD